MYVFIDYPCDFNLCIAEGEYAFRRQKTIIPLKMQRGYKADGWLGFLVGTKLYINFDGKIEFEEAYHRLCKELAGRGRKGTAEDISKLVQSSLMSVFRLHMEYS